MSTLYQRSRLIGRGIGYHNKQLVRLIFTHSINSKCSINLSKSYIHNRLVPSQTNIRSFSDNKNVPTVDTPDLEKKRLELFLEIQNTYKNQSMSPKLKAQRLKALMLNIIHILPNYEFSNKQLPFVNAVINFIDQTPKPTDSFTPDEMLTILRSVLGGMTLNDVRFIDFFPRFYNSLRESKEYNESIEVRLQLFEIFANYVLLSEKRDTISKIIEAFIKEEKSLHNHDASLEVVEILLEAFKNVEADTLTVNLLAKLCPDISAVNKEISDEPLFNRLLATFFKAADEEISRSFEDNFVSDRLLQLLDIVESKVEQPFEAYVEILNFAANNNYDKVSEKLVNKLENLTNFYKDEKFVDYYKSEVLFAILNASLKFNKTLSARNLIDILRNKQENEFDEYEWMALIQYDAYNLNSQEQSGIQLVKTYEIKLKDLESDDSISFANIETLNLLLESFCWSGKDFQYIEKFRQNFEDMYGVYMDAKGISTILKNLTKDENNDTNIMLASQYFLKHKDSIDWENDYEGFYMISLFKLTSLIWKCPKISWPEKLDVYENVKRYEFLFDKDSIYSMMKSAIKYDMNTLAIKVMLDQTPEVTKNDSKLDVKKYEKIFDCIYDLLTKSNDKILNKKVYTYLSDYFSIPYEYYPGFIKMFIDCGENEMAIKVFADLKKLSKESKLPPPNEEFYIYLLKSLTKFHDEDSIFKLHLAIKMDLSINLDITLLNALMEAYASLEDPFKTRDVFNLAFSLPKEYGINNESAYWMLKSLKYATLGHVNDFYNGLSQYEVIPDSNLFAELLIANCYHEQYRTAFEVLENAERNGDYHLITPYTLKMLHNHCLHEGVRKELKSYYQEKFPVEWEQLTKNAELVDNTSVPDLLDSPYAKPAIEVKQITA
ncbi:hypothetical protein CANINC_004079 [Pichia inconspicua]|uniref:Mitochondrial group I intron splicing factor CCM1 n=1 Tax=Pichia inconspicua TaxID=52247 RepID=A0A4T0WXH6_9ASCO|nr:hypothetical protein CANINC_004079 [[Candida] inconspicua]